MWTNHYLKEVVAVDTTGNLWSHVLRLRISRGFILGSALALSAYILGPTLFEFLTTGNPKLERASRDDKYTVGLLNKGNDCFANSSVQALASIPSFTIYLTHVLKVAEELNLLPNIAEFNTNVNYEAQADSSRPTPVNWTRTELLLHFALAEVIHNLQQLTLTPKTASLKLLIQAIERKVHATMSRGQNDAQEFTQLLLQLLDDEYKLFVKMLEKQKPTCKLPEFPFTGLIANSLVCMKCGKSSRITPGEFIMHTISVPHTTRQVDLDNLLFENQTESIEGYYCLTCDVGSVLQHSNLRNMQAITHDEAAKLRNLEALLPALHINDSLPDDLEQYLERSRQHSFRLSKPTSTILKRAVVTKSPEVLIIHLSRSYFNGMTYAKNQCKVKFQEKLTIYEQVIKNSICAGMRPVVYRLTSIIKHSGTHSQGHYECYRRKPRIKQDLSTQITKDFSPTIPPSFFECLNRNATRTCSETPSSRTDMPSHLSYFPPTAAVSAATHANAFGARLPQEETLGAITSHATTGAGSPESTSDTKQKRRYRTLKTTTSYPWWKLSDTKVREHNTNAVLSESERVYMLYYQRVPLKRLSS